MKESACSETIVVDKCLFFMPPNFEKVEGAYCFGLVHASLHLCVCSKFSQIQLCNFIYGFLIKK